MADQSITIRALDPADWNALWSLRLDALRNHPDAFGSSYEETLTAGEAVAHERFIGGGAKRIFGAFASGNTLVGTCGIGRHAHQKMRHRMEIWGVYVAPESRGTGTGTRLVEAAIEHARRVEGVLQIHLTVASHNSTAIALYSQLGFVTYGHEPRSLKLPDRFIDEVFMVLMLDTTPPG